MFFDYFEFQNRMRINGTALLGGFMWWKPSAEGGANALNHLVFELML